MIGKLNGAPASGASATAELETFVVDGHELIANYYRCPRCLYLRLRRDDPRYAEPDPEPRAFRWSAMRAIAERPGEPWFELAGQRFRLLSQGRRLVSASVPFRELAVSFVLCGSADGIVELADGSVAVVAYQKAVLGDRHEHKRRFALECEAYALEHPADGPGRRVDRLGILTFMPRGPRPDAEAAHPLRLTLFERQAPKLARVLALAAQQLAARSAPPPAPHCFVCTRLP